MYKSGAMPDGWMGMDIGFVDKNHRKKKAKTIVWNGPMGVLSLRISPTEPRNCQRVAAQPVQFSVGSGDSALLSFRL